MILVIRIRSLSTILVLLLWAKLACAQEVLSEGTPSGSLQFQEPVSASAYLIDPYPLEAAGWGPKSGSGIFASRWADIWKNRTAPEPGATRKMIEIGSGGFLSLNTEARLRYDTYRNAQLSTANNYHQTLFRGILGADLQFNPNLRMYAEVGSGQLDARRDTAASNLQNAASLQQLFIDWHGYAGTTLFGAMLGRQEFTDGPRQLLSLGDGANLHRSWNGLRLYMHERRFRVGAYHFSATRLGRDAFDEQINHAERLQGLNASVLISNEPRAKLYLDPFWIRNRNPNFRSAGLSGLEQRDTLGVRLWGQQDQFKFDWTAAHQFGNYIDRDINAWAFFTNQSMQLANLVWKPRLTVHIDIASGGSYGTKTVRSFNQLYAGSNYLSEGFFLSLSNLRMIVPGIAIAPTANTTLAFEYGFARRLDERDAVYAGVMRAYAGTQKLTGRDIGQLPRLTGNWVVNNGLNLFFVCERLIVGDVLKQAGLASANYSYIGASFRY